MSYDYHRKNLKNRRSSCFKWIVKRFLFYNFILKISIAYALKILGFLISLNIGIDVGTKQLISENYLTFKHLVYNCANVFTISVNPFTLNNKRVKNLKIICFVQLSPCFCKWHCLTNDWYSFPFKGPSL